MYFGQKYNWMDSKFPSHLSVLTIQYSIFTHSETDLFVFDLYGQFKMTSSFSLLNQSFLNINLWKNFFSGPLGFWPFILWKLQWFYSINPYMVIMIKAIVTDGACLFILLQILYFFIFSFRPSTLQESNANFFSL